MKPNLLLVSHGFLAREALNSAQLITGDIEGTYVVDVLPADGRDEIKAKIDKTLEEILSKNESLIILVDLHGGTPGNITAISAAGNPNIGVVAGLNLAMIITYAFADGTTSEIIAEMKSAGIEGIRDVELVQSNSTDDDDEIEID